MNRLLLPAFLLAMLARSHAQLDVTLEMSRNMFIRGEPVEATVVIRNLAGRDLMLTDTEAGHWFGFEIMKEGVPIAPHRRDYKNEPQVILNGGSIRRKVDLLRLYPVNEYGTYSVRAAIYFPDTRKFINSEPVKLDISEGRKLWSQTVGVPVGKDGSGGYRVFTLLSFQLPKENTLYARIEDEATGAGFGTYPLGRLVGGNTPGHEFDLQNTLHVFHLVGPKQYFLSKIGVDGEWMGQTSWRSESGRAAVRRKADGRMVVVGASRISEKPNAAPDVPRLSDRPAALPK